MRTSSLVGALFGAALVLGVAGAEATPVLDVSGVVALTDGKVPEKVKVTLSVDLDRDGELSSFETIGGTVRPDGSYRLSYSVDPADVSLRTIVEVTELLGELEARGFSALVEDGALPVIVTFEREGYSTITRTLSSLIDDIRLDALLAPLADIRCNADGCQTASGAVSIKGFPGGTGIARAFAEAYDPSLDFVRFPGSFTDSNGNLLISTGFVEVDLRNEDGEKVTQLSKPVEVRYAADPNSWHTMRDLTPDNGQVDVPMYSFDEATGQWVPEEDGVLENGDGSLIVESDLGAIREGSFAGDVYIRFFTKHFSTFNCDAPVEQRACVRGRVVDQAGNALEGVHVQVRGVSYSGSSGTFVTQSDGRFAVDVMKSELAGEDVDGNGTLNETFSAAIHLAATKGVFAGAEFATPSRRGTVGRMRAECAPSECPCEDLGDIKVEFEEARACEVSVRATFSGSSATGDAELRGGAALVEAELRGEVAATLLPASATVGLCEDGACYVSQTSGDGSATIVVPVVGDAPSINLVATLSIRDGETNHGYVAARTIAGCARGQARVEETVELEATHASSQPMTSFIASLGEGPAVVDRDGDGDTLDEFTMADPMGGCGCSQAGVGGRAGLGAIGLCSLLGLWLGRRRTDDWEPGE